MSDKVKTSNRSTWISILALVIAICAAGYAIYGHNKVKSQIQQNCNMINSQSASQYLTSNLDNLQYVFSDAADKLMTSASNQFNGFMMKSITKFNDNFGVTTKTLNRQKEFCLQNKLQCADVSDEKTYKEEALKETVAIIKNNEKTSQNLVMQYVDLNASVLRQIMFMKNYKILSEELKKDGKSNLIDSIPTVNN
tara:strand:- start:4249 stop:4833 length:585 start_codon:yes stop_codon:yes gene_type:complete